MIDLVFCNLYEVGIFFVFMLWKKKLRYGLYDLSKEVGCEFRCVDL